MAGRVLAVLVSLRFCKSHGLAGAVLAEIDEEWQAGEVCLSMEQARRLRLSHLLIAEEMLLRFSELARCRDLATLSAELQEKADP